MESLEHNTVVKSTARNISIPLDVDNLIMEIVKETGLEISYVYTVLLCEQLGIKPGARQYRYIDLDKVIINQIINKQQLKNN